MKIALMILMAALALTASAPVFAEEAVAVVMAGEAKDPIVSYHVGHELYLEAQRVARIYGGQVYWYPVSGRVQMTLHGRTVQFMINSNQATLGDENLPLSAPILIRASQAFLPISLLQSEAFERWSGLDARYDSQTKILQIDRRATVGPVHVFSYQGKTRIALDMAPNLVAQTLPRGVSALEIIVPGGVVESDELINVGDGVITSYAVKQEIRQARVTVRFTSNGLRWQKGVDSDPRRMIIDVLAPNVELATPTVAAATHSRKRVIVIDAGHGGKDPGATGTRGNKEKDINLSVALELYRILKERGDFNVLLTRSEDAFLALSDRSKIANDAKADLFVSLHCNSTRNHKERGFEVYSVSETASDPEAEKLAEAENSAMALEGKKPEAEMANQILLAMTKTEMINESAPFATLVERALARRIDVPDRGQKQAAFYVLRGTHAPAILVEMAHLSHPKDEAQLGSRRFRRRMAEGVAAGIADYARKRGWLE